MKLGKALKLGKAKTLEIDDSKEYTIAGVQSYGKGVVNRRNEIGKNLKMKKYQVIEPNFLMWCKVDTKNGAFGITKEEHKGSLASTNMALAKIDTQQFNPLFIERLFSFDFFHGHITHLSSGSTNRKYLTPKQLFELIEIPDLSKKEQDKFIALVDRIENLGISSELTHQLNLVKQLRQAFLREAMQGKLVPQDPNDEPASVLLEKIKAEKERLIQERKIKKQKPLPPITKDEIPFEIPENWVWCRLGELIHDLLGGFAFKSSKYVKESKNQVVRLGNVKNDNLLLNANPAYISDEYASTAEKAKLLSDDILVTMTGTRSKRDYLFTLLLNDKHFEDLNLYLNQRVGAFRLNDLLKKEFITFLLKEPRILEPVFLSSTGAANQANIGVAALNNILVPLPPLSEQQRIVAKLDELMQYCDKLEVSIKESQSQNELLLQQVLREALEPKT
jgi:type I restriction enzyme S subunit